MRKVLAESIAWEEKPLKFTSFHKFMLCFEKAWKNKLIERITCERNGMNRLVSGLRKPLTWISLSAFATCSWWRAKALGFLLTTTTLVLFLQAVFFVPHLQLLEHASAAFRQGQPADFAVFKSKKKNENKCFIMEEKILNSKQTENYFIPYHSIRVHRREGDRCWSDRFSALILPTRLEMGEP